MNYRCVEHSATYKMPALVRLINKQESLKTLSATVFLVISFLPVLAYSDIYSCPTADGGTVFTNQPCSEDSGVTVYEETEEDLRRQLQNKLERERRAAEAETQRRLRQILDLLWAGDNNRAKDLAIQYGWGGKLGEIDAMFQNEVIERQNQKIAEQNARIAAQQQMMQQAQAQAASEAKARARTDPAARFNTMMGEGDPMMHHQPSHPSQGSNIGQCMGNCASEQGICISQCRGDGQCIGSCTAAQGRCVSRCN